MDSGFYIDKGKGKSTFGIIEETHAVGGWCAMATVAALKLLQGVLEGAGFAENG